MHRLLVSVLLVIIFLGNAYTILLPYAQRTKNPYTPGIKTTNLKNDENVLTHHNYSKVFVHNQPSSNGQYVIAKTEETQRLYPIYNAHSYGPRPETEAQLEWNLQDKNESENAQRTLYKRKIEYKTLEIYEKCPSGATGQFVYHLSCNQFLNCWKGRGSVQNCAAGTLFNPKTLECDYMDKVECITGPRQSTLGARVTKSVKQASCPEGFSGLMPNYTDCSKFISCNDGQGTPMDCAPGTLFNINLNVCDHPENVECFGGTSKGTYQSGPCQTQANCAPTGQQYYHAEPSTGQSWGHGQQSSTVCNPQLQNCQQIGQTSSGIPNCNNQNCGQGFGRGQVHSQYPSSGQSYLLQPTGNHYSFGSVGSNQQHSGSKTSPQHQVNPTGQENEYNQNADRTHHTGRVTNQTRCNPFLQNCGPGIYYQRPNTNPTAGATFIPSVPSTSQGQVKIFSQGRCDPQTQNCQPLLRQGPISAPQTGCDSLSGNCQPNIGDNNEQVYPTNVQTTTCNPRTQNCNMHQIDAGSGSYPFNIRTQTACDPRTENCNSGCDPQTGNCNPVAGQASSTYHTTYHIYPSNVERQTTSYSNANCDPQSQNCNLSNTQYKHQTDGQTYPAQDQTSSHSHVNCDPGSQNCNQAGIQGSYILRPIGQGYPSVKGTTSYSQISCDPSTQNCNPSITKGSYIHSTTRQRYPSNVQGQTSHGQRICDPLSQNCNSDTVQGSYTYQPNGQRYPNNVHDQITPHPSKGCDLQSLSCNQAFGQNTNTNGQPSPDRGYIVGQTSNYKNQNQNSCQPNQNCQGQTQLPQKNCDPNSQGCSQNYHTICNINDPDCRQPHNIVSKDTSKQMPKCPDGYQGITKHPFDCNKFLNCANGQTFVQDCAPGTLFNPLIGNCDFPHNVDCDQPGARTDVPQKQDRPNIYDTHINAGQGNERIPDATQKPDHTYPEINRNVIDYNRGQSGILNKPTSSPHKSTEDPDDPKHYTFRATTTVRSVESWSPYTSSDPNADYVFEYDNGEPVTLQPENIIQIEKMKKKSDCRKGDFYCSSKTCVTKPMVCDGHKDCENGRDEIGCEEYIGRFTGTKNHRLDVLEKQRWLNVSYITCALLCTESIKFNCRSFSYRKMDKTCFLSDLNVGLTGTLRKYYPFDYYELKAGTIDCSDKSKYFQCSNKKCLTKRQLCDGHDDCGDRDDEKGCNPKDFGYSVKLAGSKERHEGRIEVTAFRKTGYVCDDQFTLRDANVICKELGFEMGAVAVKGQSYFAKDLKENDTLYMMDEVDCLGNETSLIDCNFAGWGVHNCKDGEIAGVVCKTPQQTCPPKTWKCDNTNECLPFSFLCDGLDDCADGSDEADEHCEGLNEIRLINGTSANEGRIEISHYGIWGTICDDDFNEDAAKVVCQSLGYTGKVIVKKEGFFGSGEGPIWLDQVSCYGNETSLEECVHWDWGEHNCDHTEDVGVICSNEEEEVVEIQRSSSYSKHFLETSGGLPKNCGFRKDNQFLDNDLIHERVISGYTARRGDYPWQAAIRVRAKEKTAHWCGAVVISSKWVLTAAHCLQGYAKGAYVIVAGEYNTDEDEGTEQQKYIDEYFVHEDFRKGHKMNNDIALVKLKGSGFVLNENIQPICIPDADADYGRDLNCTISGFGTVNSGNSAFSHNMMAAWIPVHTNDICRMPHVYGDALTDGMICAGSLDGGVDACDGDSGGPLACLDRGVFTLYGLTSWGHHCGYANKPGVYVKVAYYRKWIENILEKHSN